MSGSTPAGPKPAAGPRSPALRRLLFSVGAWITAATLTAIGNLGTGALNENSAVTWLFSQFAPVLMALLTIGLLVSLVAGLLRLRTYRQKWTWEQIDPIGPPPAARSHWQPGKDADAKVTAALDNPQLRIDRERVHRIDVRGVHSDTPWWDAADRILMALQLPGVGLQAGSDDAKSDVAERCAAQLGERALLVLEQERRRPDRTRWLLPAFTELGVRQNGSTGAGPTEPGSAGGGPYLLVIEDKKAAAADLTKEPAADLLLLQAFAALPVDVLDTEGLTALNNEIAVFLETIEDTVDINDTPRTDHDGSTNQHDSTNGNGPDRQPPIAGGTHSAGFRYSPTRAFGLARRYTMVDDRPTARRFRIRRPLRLALRRHQRGTRDELPAAAQQIVRAATPWVLRHYAMLCTAWCAELGVPDRAPLAARWFRTNEPLLRTLVIRARGGSHAQPKDEQLWLVLEDLARIADGLDIWYRREHQAHLAVLVANALRRHADRLEQPTLRELAVLRRGAADRALGRTPPATTREWSGHELRKHPRRLRASLLARTKHDAAMTALCSGDHDHDQLAALEQQLRDAWMWLPRKDLVGATTILINLSIVHLKQGRLQPARDRLELAESLAATANDASAQARATELLGVVAWSEGHGSRAMREWERARELYRALGERYGDGRCAQHLGSAVVHSPAMAAVGLTAREPTDQPSPESGVTRPEADRYAWRMLTAAKQMLGDEGTLASEYLQCLEARSAHDMTADTAAGPAPTDEPVVAGRSAERDRPPSVERILRDIRKLVRKWNRNNPKTP